MLTAKPGRSQSKTAAKPILSYSPLTWTEQITKYFAIWAMAIPLFIRKIFSGDHQDEIISTGNMGTNIPITQIRVLRIFVGFL